MLHLVGKGNKPATMPVTVPVLRALEARRGQRTTEPLVLRPVSGKPINRRDVYRMVARIAKTAAIPRHISPHSLRHAAITNALDAGVPLRDAQILARHADLRTTEHYDRARARHGDRRGKDPHRDRARGPDEQGELGQARPVPGGSYGPGQAGCQRVQDACLAPEHGQPVEREVAGRARVRVDVPDDAKPDPAGRGERPHVRARVLRPDRHRRGAPVGAREVRGHLRLLRRPARWVDGDPEG